MISLRGLLALGIGAIFLYCAVYPLRTFGEIPPVWVSAALWVGAGVLLAGGVMSLHFVYRRYTLMQKVTPQPVKIAVQYVEGSDSDSATAQVLSHGQSWEIGIDPCALGKSISQRGVVSGEAWMAPGRGDPVALRVDGKMLRTYSAARPIEPTKFGQKN